MPTINGEKYACISCVRGHRVSTCYHADRELKLIPPKGRPVKQCEHCRTARKSKSHHGKCDCGSKKDKKDQDGFFTESKSECCCQVGKSCRCSTRSDAVELRMERSLKRPTVPVQSKPVFTKSQSDDKLLHVVNGHHKPCHRNNNAAHTSGQPYTIPRPHSHHGQSQATADIKQRTLPQDKIESMFAQTTSIIPESNEDILADEIIAYDFDKHFSSASQSHSSAPLSEDMTEGTHSYDSDWIQKSAAMGTSSLPSLTIDTSPNFSTDVGYPLFSPADLPLISPQVTNFNQTISHSSDFTNESAWTVDNYLVDGQVAVQDSWPDANAALLDTVLKSTNYGDIQAFAGTGQPAYVTISTGLNNAQSQSPTKNEHVNNSMIIPADPDSPREEVVEDWWPQNSFTSSASAKPSSQLLSQQSSQSMSQLRSQSMDTTNYDANYDWLY